MLKEIIERLKQGFLLESDYPVLVEALDKGDIRASGPGAIAARDIVSSHLTTLVIQFGNGPGVEIPEQIRAKLIEAVRRAVHYNPVTQKVSDQVSTPSSVILPRLNVPAFKVVPSPNTGANWKPDPSHLIEERGYQFTGHFEVEAGIDCDVRSISLHLMRNDHLAICVGPGKASYYNGPLPNMDGKFGFVTIDGDKHYVDANYNFLRLLRYKAGQKLIVSIGRWCRAIGMSRNDPATQSLWYWIEDPTQLLRLEYSCNGLNFAEEHYFIFKNATEMELQRKVLTEM